MILALNCGSSSLKFTVYDWETHTTLSRGTVERIGDKDSFIEYRNNDGQKSKKETFINNHETAIKEVLNILTDSKTGVIKDISEIKTVGHRFVHGGELVKNSIIVNSENLTELEKLNDLAPLHNPANLIGIKAAITSMPNATQTITLDTAFHQTMPEKAYLYALPYEWYEKFGVRKYGFHGTSFLYTSRRLAKLLGQKPSETNAIIAHIGNGASICAVENGKSIDTSMGLTPLSGLIMGTRCGDIDPAIIPFMENKLGIDSKEVEKLLNKKSGLLGITECYTDRRDIKAEISTNPKCKIAVDMEAYRIAKYIGSYMAALPKTDAIVFTAGVGERGDFIRERICSYLESFGIKIDKELNNENINGSKEDVISTKDSSIPIYIIPTNEEIVIIEDAYALSNKTYSADNYTYSFEK